MKRLWFKRKSYGWGWYPATWQGWVIIFIYTLLIFLFTSNIRTSSTTLEVISTFVVPLILLTISLILICYKTGEKPRWQWGDKKK